jgi:hypothetical protein
MKKSKHTMQLRKTAILFPGLFIILAATGAAADSHLGYDENCILCLLRINTPAVQAPDIILPILLIVELFDPIFKAITPQQPLPSLVASRGPPSQFLSILS